MSTPDGRLGGDRTPEAAEAPNVLYLAPAMTNTHDACVVEGASPDETNLLAVSLSGTPEAQLAPWRQLGGLPHNVGIVTTGDTRGAAAADSPSVGGPGSNVRLTTVSDAGDLTGIGIKMSQCLSAWADGGGRTVVCFDSITTLLQYVDVQRAFRFLHVLTRRIESVDGSARFHMDPAAHDERTLATVRSLFDAVYEYDEATGEWNRA